MSNSGSSPETSAPLRKAGPVEGVEYDRTEAQDAANRDRNWKTGKYARHITASDHARNRLGKIDESYPDVLEGFIAAVSGESSDAVSAMAAVSLTDTEIFVRRPAVRDIAEHGLTQQEELFDKKGDRIGTRVVPRPTLSAMFAASEQLGFTAREHMLTPRSHGEGSKDSALARLAERQSKLQASGTFLDIPLAESK